MISVPSLLALSVNRTESMIPQKQSGVRGPSRFGKDPCQSARVQTRLSIDSNVIEILEQLSTIARVRRLVCVFAFPKNI